MGEIFVNHLSDKELISKICKEPIQLNSKNQIIQLENRQRTWKGISLKKTTNGQQVCEKILSITNHQGNASQNHNEPIVTSFNYYQINKKQQLYARLWRKGTLVHSWMENSVEDPQKFLSTITIWSCNPTYGYISKGNEIKISEKYLHPHVHCRIIL